MARELNFGTPVAAIGNNLATFLGNRLAMSFANLGCTNFGLTDPVNVTVDGNQVATAVAYNVAQQKAVAPPPPGRRRRRRPRPAVRPVVPAPPPPAAMAA